MNGQFQAMGHTMTEIAAALTRRLQRPVYDRTDLRGTYQLELTYSNEGIPSIPGLPPRAESTPRAGPTLTKALEEQAGLKVESRRRPVRFLKITAVESLTEN